MIRQFHAWVHAQKNWKQMCKQKLGHEYLRRHHPQTPRGGGDSTVRQQRMDERTAVHPYRRKWFKYKKEWSTDTCCGEDEPQKHYSKQKKLGPKGQIVYDSSHTNYSETDHSWLLPGARGGRNGGDAEAYGFPFTEMKLLWNWTEVLAAQHRDY